MENEEPARLAARMAARQARHWSAPHTGWYRFHPGPSDPEYLGTEYPDTNPPPDPMTPAPPIAWVRRTMAKPKRELHWGPFAVAIVVTLIVVAVLNWACVASYGHWWFGILFGTDLAVTATLATSAVMALLDKPRRQR